MEKALSLDTVYVLTGVLLWIFAALTLRDATNPRRISSALFWFLFGVVFAFGSLLPHWTTGLLVLVMVAVDGAGGVASGKPAPVSGGSPPGNRIFLPVLLIPAVTFAFAAGFRLLGLDAGRGALIGLGFGSLAGMAAAVRLTKSPLPALFQEGHRLNDAMGSVSILPQLLASLGVVFTAAKVGDLIAAGIQRLVPADNLLLLVLANCAAMTLFTMVTGNSFAAFPVIAAGVLVPLIVKPFGADPAMAGIITLTAGSSGTLMTMMAANFNLVPVALLNMRDPYGVIKFQLPCALTIWTCHVLLLWTLIRWF